MIRALTIAAVSAAVLMFSPAAFAQQTRGTADEAKAMLMKAVAAVKADKAKALDMFTTEKVDSEIGTYMFFALMPATASRSRMATPTPSN
jgi:hypothetical protein